MIYSITANLYDALPNASAINGEYLFWWPHWQTVRDCLLGEIMIKARKERYLPKPEGQTDDEYKAYLNRATYYNASARTVSGLVGAVHSRSPIIEGLPSIVDLSNVTNDGQSFDMFMKKITKEVIAVGRYGVMIDAPPNGGTPYFVGYVTEDIVDWSTERIGSREKLMYVVLREIRKERLPFTRVPSEHIENYRVLFIDNDGFYKQRVYETGDIGSDKYTEVVPTINGRPLTEIPFLFIGPYDFGTDVEKPPILDICLMNLSHYRSYAHLEAGRYLTATPIYNVFLSGGAEGTIDYKVGPGVVWELGGQDKTEILEFTGQGLRSLEIALSTKEQQMASLGGKLAQAPTGVAAETSDAVIARERGEVSFLSSVVATMSEAASRLLSALTMWQGVPAEVNVTYSSDATKIYLDGREIRAMAMLYDTGLMPLETIYTVFRQNNIIPSGISFEEFKNMLPEYAPKVANKIIEAEEKAKIELEYAPEPLPQAQNTQNQ